jgi:hypothetical protein
MQQINNRVSAFSMFVMVWGKINVFYVSSGFPPTIAHKPEFPK